MRSESELIEEKFSAAAAEAGLAVALVDEHSRQLASANNNSICRVLNPAETFSQACSEYCGKAFERAQAADGGIVDYECFAGLSCSAVQILRGGRKLVAITGRAFVKSENYRLATNRAVNGDWKRYRPTEFFDNILMSASTEAIRKLAETVASSADVVDDLLDLDGPPPVARANVRSTETSEKQSPEAETTEISRLIKKFNETKDAEPQASVSREIQPVGRDDLSVVRSLFSSVMRLGYRRACSALLDFVYERYGINSLLWFEIKENRFKCVVGRGPITEKTVDVGISGDNALFVEAARRQLPLVLRERTKQDASPKRILNLFPVVVGGEIRAALAAEGAIAEREKQRAIAAIAQSVSSQLEILRLRDEVSKRDWLARAVRKFNESLKTVDADDFWLRLTQVSAEILGAERASLLVRNEKSDRLQAKAAVGSLIDLIGEINVGERVARPALEAGKPLVVTGVASHIAPAPDEWRYKSDSFLAFPVAIGDRKIAVLNFTDRADGEAFGSRDVELMQAITPQIAMAIDRASLKDKAGEYEQLSVTDSLTGLLNRRYLQERMSEEIQRSKRHRYPMSVLMLDVDKFKSYNDMYGHLAGDEALRTVAGILKENLRGDDVAARYGGEEFAILLPQTNSEEACVIAERIRTQIERTEFPYRNITVSIGVARTTTDIHMPEDILWAADRALYEAKGRGRNNVKLYNDFAEENGGNIH